MNTTEKLRFLADRAEDGKEFYIGNLMYKFSDRVLLKLFDDGYASIMSINTIINHTFKLKPQWSFTDDEKVILRNLPEEYKWIVRDENGEMTIYSTKPDKSNGFWLGSQAVYSFESFTAFKHIFKSIQWLDDEPCEFREYL